MPEIVAAIDDALSHRSRDQWGEIFDSNGIIWGPVLALHEVASDPQAEALSLFPALDSDEIGTYRTVAAPMRFVEAEVGPKFPAPKLGEHTRQILADAGHNEGEIDALVKNGAVGDSS